MTQYLTYQDYINMGGDASLAEPAYTRHELRARKVIDRLTFNRLQGESPLRDTVKMLMFELVMMYATNEVLQRQEAAGYVASWANDDVRAEIKQAASLPKKALNQQAVALVQEYLTDEFSADGLPLLYRGVPICS